ncbi:hypothetical protein [Flavobacterium flavipallidum]|uniref:Uncharacterized protein n=1 Tax=Flavobacterium flavipallidum TaxID=3139140 RepID=A0ABU9HKF0_9FLAO
MHNFKIKNKAILISFISCCYSCINSNENIKSLTKDKLTNSIEKKAQLTKYTYSHSFNLDDKFTHQIKGKDEDGNDVKGIINLQGEIAEGTIKNDENKEIEIVSEHIQSNRIIATDINGFRYQLKLDE